MKRGAVEIGRRGNSSAVESNELLYNGESEAVSAFFGCIKGLKDIRKRFRSNMRTGIADFEGKARIILVLVDTEKGEADGNLAFFAGGLERILYEIDQDTADPYRITVKGL